MDDISEQIDLVLESSLEEFVRASSLKGATRAKRYDPDAFLRGGPLRGYKIFSSRSNWPFNSNGSSHSIRCSSRY